MTRTELAVAQAAAAAQNPNALLGVGALTVLTGYKRSALYQKSRSGDFPAPVMRGRWLASAVTDWLRAQSRA